jgi:hypothetical protein
MSAGRVASRVLAVAGPVDTAVLAAFTLFYRHHDHTPPTAGDLTNAPTTLECRGRPGRAVNRRHRVSTYRVVPGDHGGRRRRDPARPQMITVLIAARYTSSSANELSRIHPLFTHTGPTQCRLLNRTTSHRPGRWLVGPDWT